MIKNVFFFLCFGLILLGCSEQKETKKTTPAAMKCGASKCGANMFDSSSALAKKKNNILRQMEQDDPRKECVINAKTTKEVYNCVRSSKTGKLIKKEL